MNDSVGRMVVSKVNEIQRRESSHDHESEHSKVFVW
jgi:hypothetical protein